MTIDRSSSHDEGELRIKRCVWCLDERHTERLVNRWRLRTTRDNANLSTIHSRDDVALPSDTGAIEVEPD